MTIDLSDTVVGRQMLQFYHSDKNEISIIMKGAARKEWINFCADNSKLLEGFYGDDIPDRTYHLYKFSNGYMGAASPGDISTESWDLLKRAARVFALAYTRFSDLQKAESQAEQARQHLIQLQVEKNRAESAFTELQSTQQQLIQSEKMASLGELTAGIAHEIQNPLNFVNNFSEVNLELIDEMKTELKQGNTSDALEITDILGQNLQKIAHHGKRADGIVKGMLQHSSKSSGSKEPVDINALVDEYLRLSYHGFRAKDKSFNAIMETYFDSSIGKVNVVGQEIGRVLLNLLNNAFYSVNEKKKHSQYAQWQNYEPRVYVSTEKQGDHILIKVKDNGTGIPEKVLQKIYQPFFTTKPTGEGTGLGLSLSYDIITKGHGGELKVETKEGEGSIFIIQLTASKNNYES
ncbi:MAG: two-component sensor histidine kinase [Nitrosopumilus sp.]|nr:two-component sensor histidine kinase [Nitrosopumilus sp.]